jgi:hypothetical protein
MKKQILSEELKRMQKLAGIPLNEAQDKAKISDEDMAYLKAFNQSIEDLKVETKLKISQLIKQQKEKTSELADKYLGDYEGQGDPQQFEPYVDYWYKTIEWRSKRSDTEKYYASMRG